LGGVAAGAAVTGALIPIDGISVEPDDRLSFPVSTKAATDLEPLFMLSKIRTIGGE